MKFTLSAYTHQVVVNVVRFDQVELRIAALLALGYFVVDCEFYYL